MQDRTNTTRRQQRERGEREEDDFFVVLREGKRGKGDEVLSTSPIETLNGLPTDFEQHIKSPLGPLTDDTNVEFIVRSAEEAAQSFVLEEAERSKVVQLLVLQKLWNNLCLNNIEFNRAFEILLSVGVRL